METSTSLPMPAPLARALWPSKTHVLVRGSVLVLVGVVLLTLGAKAQVPFYPVPMTLQTLAVLVLASAYGWRLGVVTVVLYLVLGAAGLPVLSGTPERGLGLAYMSGPTGGYLLGFVLATALVGSLADRGWDRRLFGAGLAMTFGGAVILFTGWLWLAALMGPMRALVVGVVPFLPAAVLKICLAMCLLPLVWTLVRRRQGRR